MQSTRPFPVPSPLTPLPFLPPSQFHMLPSFTKLGFEVAEAPKDVHKALRERLLQYGDATPAADSKVSGLQL